jgi:hypothetical protein
MKKFLTTAAAVFALVAVSNAQLFVGGNLGFSTSSETEKNSDGDGIKQNGASMSFEFNPQIGFELNDKMSVGAYVILGTSSTKTFDGSKDNKVTTKTVSNEIGIAPFFRYSFVEFGDFKVMAEAALPFAIASGKLSYPDADPARDAVKAPKTMNIGLAVAPVVSYSISDRIDLEAQLNVFSLGYYFSSTNPNPDADGKERNNSSDFQLGVSPDDVFTTGAINVGMIFKF